MATKRANGAGSVYWDATRKRFRAAYTDAAGRRRYVSDLTEAGASRKLRQAQHLVDGGVSAGDGRLTVNGWLDTWLRAPGRNGPVKPATARWYADMAAWYIRPTLGTKLLARLAREDVKAMLTSVRERPGCNDSTVQRAYDVLRIALNEAVRSEKVARNVADTVARPASSGYTIDPWSPEEINAFLDAITGDRNAPMFALAIATGCRQGELLGLQWNDVDWDTGMVAIVRQFTRGKDYDDPKRNQRRTIGIGNLGMWALRAQRAQQARERIAAGPGWADSGHVFATVDGRPMQYRSLSKSFERAQVRAGVRHQRFHDMRHACATLMLTAGEDLAVISKVLGHTDYSTTVNIYAHLSKDRAKVAAARIDQVLNRRHLEAVADAGV